MPVVSIYASFWSAGVHAFAIAHTRTIETQLRLLFRCQIRVEIHRRDGIMSIGFMVFQQASCRIQK